MGTNNQINLEHLGPKLF